MDADAKGLRPERVARRAGAPLASALAGLASIALFQSAIATDALAEQPGAALGPVDKSYFGLVINRSVPGQSWPDVPFGSWRLWDTHVTWPFLEPQRGRWHFAELDRMIEEAIGHHVVPLLVLAHSPQWASARPSEPSGYGRGFAAEPANMDDWREYVRQVGSRYRGRITEYEIWNEPSDKTHFSGSIAKLVELTCEARRVLKAIDPNITVVSPGEAGPGYHVKYIDDFLASGGARCIDVVGYHFYAPRLGPEAMVPIIRQVRAVMRKNGMSTMPLWNTESGWWIANTDGTPDSRTVASSGWRRLDADREAGGVIARALLLARAEGVSRFYYYAWNNPYGWSLTDGAGNPKPAAQYWTQLAEKMLGRVVTGCASTGSGYACELTLADSPPLILRWSDPTALTPREGPADVPASEAAIPH